MKTRFAKRLFLKASSIAVAATLLKACGGGGNSSDGQAPTPPAPSPVGAATLLQRLQQEGRFSNLLAAANRAGLAAQLDQDGASQTLFAPTNDAFAALAQRIGFGDAGSMIGALTVDQLAGILGFHVVPQRLYSADLESFGQPGGQRPGTLYDFRGVAAQLIFIAEGGQLSLWDGIGRTSITIQQFDLAASNGVLHVVSDVLLPRGVLTVSQTLRANIDSFAGYSAAVTAAGFSDELQGSGPFTVFVPSDNVINGPLASNVVRYHVLGQELGVNSFPAGANFTTLNNSQTVRIARGRTPPLSNSAGQSVLATLTDATTTPGNVIDVDFYASNGVIHVLDKVLVPR
jgi:transforming growth factor-beta-induced protein